MGALTYYVASTLDGFIAHADGSFDGFVWDDELVADFFRDIERFATVLMGRKTYEVGLRDGKTSPYPAMRQIVFSRTMEASPDPAVELVRDGAVEFVRDLRATTPGDVWLCGGAELASTLLAAGLIDEVVVKLNPVVFGAGIPLLAAGVPPTRLALRGTRTYGQSGIVVLHYAVTR